MAKGQSKNATVVAPLFVAAPVQSAEHAITNEERALLLDVANSPNVEAIIAAANAAPAEQVKILSVLAEDAKRRAAISTEKIRDAAGMAIGLSVTFGDGAGFQVTAANYSAYILAEGLWHGVSAKYVDAAAISRNPDTGRSATIADKKAAVLVIREQIEGPDGRWNRGREGIAHAAGTLVYRALCRLYPNRTPEQVRAFFDGKTDDERKRMAGDPRVIRAIADIRAEQAAAAPPAPADMFAGLDD